MGTVYVQEDETGRPVVSFVAPDSVSVWRVMRAEEDGLTEIARLEGKQGEQTEPDAPEAAEAPVEEAAAAEEEAPAADETAEKPAE